MQNPAFRPITVSASDANKFCSNTNTSPGESSPYSTSTAGLTGGFDRGLHLQQNSDILQLVLSQTSEPDLQTPPCIDVQGDPRRKQFLDAVLAAMNNARVDAIIYPTWSNPPRLLGDRVSPHGNNSPIIAPHTGQPAITVPMGFVSSNLPAGLQF